MTAARAACSGCALAGGDVFTAAGSDDCPPVAPSGALGFFFTRGRRLLRLSTSPVASTVAVSTARSAGVLFGRCSGTATALAAAVTTVAISFLLVRKGRCGVAHRGQERTVTPQRPQLKQIKVERGCVHTAHPCPRRRQLKQTYGGGSTLGSRGTWTNLPNWLPLRWQPSRPSHFARLVFFGGSGATKRGSSYHRLCSPPLAPRWSSCLSSPRWRCASKICERASSARRVSARGARRAARNAGRRFWTGGVGLECPAAFSTLTCQSSTECTGLSTVIVENNDESIFSRSNPERFDFLRRRLPVPALSSASR